MLKTIINNMDDILNLMLIISAGFSFLLGACRKENKLEFIIIGWLMLISYYTRSK